MKKTFIKTKNVEKFILLMDSLLKAQDGLSKMAVVYGEPGLGKTFIIHRWATENKAIYIRAAHKMTTCWLLQEIANELCLNSFYSTKDNYEIVIKALKKQKRIIFVDEVDYLCGQEHIIETLRDIGDVTNSPIVFVGMDKLNVKISRYEHIKDRIYKTLKFEYFDKEELKTVLQSFTNIEFTESAIDYLSTRKNQFRQIMKLIDKIEKHNELNNINIVDEQELKGFLNERRIRPITSFNQKIKQNIA